MDFIDHVGDLSLLEQHTVGFFASRRVAPLTFAHCREWAETVCRYYCGEVVVSGFHSPLESELIRIFLAHRHPIVWVLGKSISVHWDPDVFRAVEAGRCLVLSVASGRTHTRESSLLRNRYIAEMTRENVFAAFDSDSGLAPLYEWSDAQKQTIVIR